MKEMTILIADEPVTNSYVTSLIEEYKKQGIKIICGSRNFFHTNFVPDVLHIQWPEKVYNTYPFSALPEKEKAERIEERLKWFKQNNAVIVHTIHNIKPHIPSQPDFEKEIFRMVISYSDLLVHHCSKSIEMLKKNYPEAESKINILNHHPDYLIDFREVKRTDARNKLKLDKKDFIILNFGNQKKYKNEDFIESVFKELPIKEKYLLTAGDFIYAGYKGFDSFKIKLRNKLREKINYRNRKYFYKKISPNDLPFFFSGADIIFLGHSKGLNSGILPLAATFAKPVVFPDVGCFKEQMAGWVFEAYASGDKKSAVQGILNIYNEIKTNKEKNFDNSMWLEKNSWKIHVKKVLDQVEKLRTRNKSLKKVNKIEEIN